MTKSINKPIELAIWFDKKGDKKSLNIEQYLGLVDAKDKKQISEFIYHRLYSRYLKPFSFDNTDFKNHYKNGFSIMANCCLLIETLQSFKSGWGDSKGKSQNAFEQFLKSEKRFVAFAGKEKAFYINVRCGILHQGETTKGWKIKRKGVKLFDAESMTINSVKFANELKNCLKEYSDSLESAEWDSELWHNFRFKMKKIISNCKK